MCAGERLGENVLGKVGLKAGEHAAEKLGERMGEHVLERAVERAGGCMGSVAMMAILWL